MFSRNAIAGILALFATLTPVAASPQAKESSALFARTFDAHWESLRDEYPYFELYGVDWDQERSEHRPLAIAAKDGDEFAWELARLFSVLPDPHNSFIPSLKTIKGRWSYPDIEAQILGQHIYAMSWPSEQQLELPAAYTDALWPCPEITKVQGVRALGMGEILAAGPLGSSFSVSLRWPDGSETEHQLKRPDVSNLPPPKRHFGDRWLISGRVGKLGYIWVRTFSPEQATLGPDGKMTTMLRAALKDLADTQGLILDMQGNGGGRVSASDPFLGHFLRSKQSYRWGGNARKSRVIRPGRPHYGRKLVVLVDERSASGGEWAARILRDAERATVIGGTTVGAEAAVHTSTGPDGSVLKYSAWPMVEPGVTPFQAKGVEVDEFLPLTIEDIRAHGLEQAKDNVRRARFAAALEALGAPAGDLDALMILASED